MPLELQHPIKTGELKIITQDFTEQTSPPTGMTEEDQEKLLRDHILITDKRDSQKTTIPYDVQTEKAFFNPTATGLYEILTRAGNFERCLVLLRPQGPRVRADFATVIRLGEPRNWRNIGARSLWAVNASDAESKEDFAAWFKTLPETQDLAVGKSRRYIVIGPNGDATLPFRVDKSLGDQNDSDVYEVSFDTYCPGPYSLPAAYPSYGKEPYSDVFGYDAEYGQRIHLNGKDGQQLFNNRGDVYVPKGFRVLAVEPDETDKDIKDGDNTDSYPMPCPAGQSDNPPIMPGDITDVELNILGKTAAFKVWSDGSQVEINNGPRLTPLDGLITLVRDHGFTEPVARGILKRAAQQRKFTCRVIYPEYIKEAGGNPNLTGQGPVSPVFPPVPYGGNSIMGSSVQTQLPLEQEVPVPGMQPEIGNRALYDPTQNLSGPEKNTLNQAVDQGQKEIFDTSMIPKDQRSAYASRRQTIQFVEQKV